MHGCVRVVEVDFVRWGRVYLSWTLTIVYISKLYLEACLVAYCHIRLWFVKIKNVSHLTATMYLEDHPSFGVYICLYIYTYYLIKAVHVQCNNLLIITHLVLEECNSRQPSQYIHMQYV